MGVRATGLSGLSHGWLQPAFKRDGGRKNLRAAGVAGASRPGRSGRSPQQTSPASARTFPHGQDARATGVPRDRRLSGRAFRGMGDPPMLPARPRIPIAPGAAAMWHGRPAHAPVASRKRPLRLRPWPLLRCGLQVTTQPLHRRCRQFAAQRRALQRRRQSAHPLPLLVQERSARRTRPHMGEHLRFFRSRQIAVHELENQPLTNFAGHPPPFALTC